MRGDPRGSPLSFPNRTRRWSGRDRPARVALRVDDAEEAERAPSFVAQLVRRRGTDVTGVPAPEMMSPAADAHDARATHAQHDVGVPVRLVSGIPSRLDLEVADVERDRDTAAAREENVAGDPRCAVAFRGVRFGGDAAPAKAPRRANDGARTSGPIPARTAARQSWHAQLPVPSNVTSVLITERSCAVTR